MKFCNFPWSIKTDNDRGSKIIYCELEEGHTGQHKCGSRTKDTVVPVLPRVKQ